MSYRGATLRIPFDAAGFQHNRNEERMPPPILVDGSKNYDLHEGGISKRGGTTAVLSSALSGNPEGRGIFQFVRSDGQKFTLFSDSNGNLYSNSESNIIKSGMSPQNIYSFSVFANECYIADGNTVPQVFDGTSVRSVTPATDWTLAGDYPFQMFPVSLGANQRMLAVTRDAVYLSANNDGDDFSDGSVVKIPIYARKGPVSGGVEWNGSPWVFTKTQSFRIDISASDTASWGYQEMQFSGGVAHWRLIVKAGNDVFLMNDSASIYSIRAVNSAGDYEQANLTRPAFIDRWIKEKVNLSAIERFHGAYDENQRSIIFFVQVSGTFVNTAIRFYLDRPVDRAWAIHNNPVSSSGYDAAASAQFEISPGVRRIRTISFAGQIYTLDQSTMSDDDVPYEFNVKFGKIFGENPRTTKHFRRGLLYALSNTDTTVTIRVWISGERKSDRTIQVGGTGATFGSAMFDSSYFARAEISAIAFDLEHYGKDAQIELVENEAGTDLFLAGMDLLMEEIGVIE